LAAPGARKGPCRSPWRGRPQGTGRRPQGRGEGRRRGTTDADLDPDCWGCGRGAKAPFRQCVRLKEKSSFLFFFCYQSFKRCQFPILKIIISPYHTIAFPGGGGVTFPLFGGQSLLITLVAQRKFGGRKVRSCLSPTKDPPPFVVLFVSWIPVAEFFGGCDALHLPTISSSPGCPPSAPSPLPHPPGAGGGNPYTREPNPGHGIKRRLNGTGGAPGERMYFRTLCPETNDFAGMAEKDKQMIVRRYQRFETPSSHNPITQYHAMGSPFLLLCWAASVPFHGIDPSQSTAATSAIEVLGPVPGDGAPLCVPRPVVGTGLRGKGPLVAGDGDGDGLPVGNRRPGGGGRSPA